MKKAIMKPTNKILVIDDNPIILDMLYEFFTERKYEVVSASNGLDGLKLFKMGESNIELVITDVVMPDISGVGIISILKKNYPGVPIIAITGLGDQPEALATEVNADIVLKKPFNLTLLEQSVQELISRKKNRDGL